MSIKVIYGRDTDPQRMYVVYEDVLKILEELGNGQASVLGRNSGGGGGTGERGEGEGTLGSGDPDGGHVGEEQWV